MTKIDNTDTFYVKVADFGWARSAKCWQMRNFIVNLLCENMY